MTTIESAVEALIEKHGGLRKAARAVKVSAPYLSRLRYSEKDNPSERVLRILGLEKSVTFKERK